jgi:hypothetical protein
VPTRQNSAFHTTVDKQQDGQLSRRATLRKIGNEKELDAKVCVPNLHTAHFSLSDGPVVFTVRGLPRRSLNCTITSRQRCGGAAVDTPSQEDSAKFPTLKLAAAPTPVTISTSPRPRSVRASPRQSSRPFPGTGNAAFDARHHVRSSEVNCPAATQRRSVLNQHDLFVVSHPLQDLFRLNQAPGELLLAGRAMP